MATKKKEYYTDPTGFNVPARLVSEHEKLRDRKSLLIAKEWAEMEERLVALKKRTKDHIDCVVASAANSAGVKTLGGAKGNIQFRSYDSNITISYDKPKRTEFDERLRFAQDLMLEALRDLLNVGQAVEDLVTIVMEFYRPNRSGNIDKQKVRELRKITRVKHAKWQQAIKILGECERTIGYREYIRVSVRQPDGKSRNILLDIAKV